MVKSIVTKLANIYWVISDLMLCALLANFSQAPHEFYHINVILISILYYASESQARCMQSTVFNISKLHVWCQFCYLTLYCIPTAQSSTLGHLPFDAFGAFPLDLFPWSSDSKFNVLHSRNLQYLLLGYADTWPCLTDFIHF